MKFIKNGPAFQGDVMFVKIDSLPKNERLEPVKPKNGNLIVAHSETGHHHVIAAEKNEMFLDLEQKNTGYLTVYEPSEVVHLREEDTHETLNLSEGNYMVRYQRQATVRKPKPVEKKVIVETPSRPAFD